MCLTNTVASLITRRHGEHGSGIKHKRQKIAVISYLCPRSRAQYHKIIRTGNACFKVKSIAQEELLPLLRGELPLANNTPPSVARTYGMKKEHACEASKALKQSSLKLVQRKNGAPHITKTVHTGL